MHAPSDAAGGAGSVKDGEEPMPPSEKQAASLDAGVALPPASGTADGSVGVKKLPQTNPTH